MPVGFAAVSFGASALTVTIGMSSGASERANAWWAVVVTTEAACESLSR